MIYLKVLCSLLFAYWTSVLSNDPNVLIIIVRSEITKLKLCLWGKLRCRQAECSSAQGPTGNGFSSYLSLPGDIWIQIEHIKSLKSLMQ